MITSMLSRNPAWVLSAVVLCAASCGSSATPPQVAEPFGCTDRTGGAGDHIVTLSSSGLERTSRLHVPSSYDPATGAMLVLNFHGFTSNAEGQEGYAEMIPLSDRDGFLIAHPEGSQPPPQLNGWNGGACCGLAAQSEVDDVQFVSDLIDEIASEYCVDPNRVYATGMSNGGYISQRLACALSDRIAAIAPVAGLLGISAESCVPERPVSVLVFHGTADTIVPFEGGPLTDPLQVFAPPFDGLSVPDATTLWRDRNDCEPEAETSYAQGDATCEAWSCAAGTTVEQCTIEEGGHTWPGASVQLPAGKTSADIEASERIIEFFQSHPMR